MAQSAPAPVDDRSLSRGGGAIHAPRKGEIRVSVEARGARHSDWYSAVAIPLRTETQSFPLDESKDTLTLPKTGKIRGTAVLGPD